MFLSFLYCVLICAPEEAQVGETLYIFDDLLKRNIVTCVIRPKINIIQIDLACRRIFTVTTCFVFVLCLCPKYGDIATPLPTPKVWALGIPKNLCLLLIFKQFTQNHSETVNI